jgi:FMN phosphatase YigB (HAD superfamily)
MKIVKQVSLDFWNCIGIPNPEFALARTKFLAKFLDDDFEALKKIHEREKKRFDHLGEEHHIQLSTNACYYNLLCNIFAFPPKNTIASIRLQIEDMFRKYPATVLPEAVAAIKELKKRGFGINIASNTNYMGGKILRETVLYPTGIDFDFYVFSDELGYPKPSPKFFNEVFYKSVEISGDRNFSVDSIVHIGDTRATDYVGATNYGMQAVLIDGPNDLPSAIYKIIEENE